jgi:hypothetical protein
VDGVGEGWGRVIPDKAPCCWPVRVSWPLDSLAIYRSLFQFPLSVLIAMPFSFHPLWPCFLADS